MKRLLYSITIAFISSGAFTGCVPLESNNTSSDMDPVDDMGTSPDQPTDSTDMGGTDEDMSMEVPDLMPYEWKGGAKAIQVATGIEHTCALFDQGGVKCWGGNRTLELGWENVSPTNTTKYAPRMVPTLGAGVTKVTAGDGISCALRVDGNVSCWGNKFDVDDGIYSARPLPSPPLGQPAIDVELGSSHACAILQDRTVACFGFNNTNAPLGTATYDPIEGAVQVVGLEAPVIDLAISVGVTCALMEGGKVKCWGGSGDGYTHVSPAPQTVPGWHEGVTDIASGDAHTCAVKGGNLECFGNNDSGERGVGELFEDQRSPVIVPTTGSEVVEVTAYTGTTCVRIADGSVECTGDNGFGQLGNGSTDDSNGMIPVTNLPGAATQLAMSSTHTCALIEDGSIACWGDNTFGQLGVDADATSASSTPMVVAALDGGTGPEAFDGEPFEPAPSLPPGPAFTTAPTPDPYAWRGGDTPIQMTLGGDQTCALYDGGGVRCWGNHQTAQGGYDGIVYFTAPVLVPRMTEGVAQIANTGDYVCALMTTGDVMCWGLNRGGTLGTMMLEDTSAIPLKIQGIQGKAVKIALESSGGCALTDTSKVYCWGSVSREFGALSTGEEPPTATEITGIDGDVEDLTGSREHICLHFTGGGISCWDGFEEPLVFDATVTQVAFGGQHHCILDDGVVKCIGENAYGQLGDGTLDAAYVEYVDMLAVDREVASIAASDRNTYVRYADGRVAAVGSNDFGRLGVEAPESTSTLVEITGVSGPLIDIQASNDHACVMRDDGSMSCWGGNGSGCLGIVSDVRSVNTPTDVMGL